MFKIQTHYKVAAVFLFVLTLSILSGGKAHAASFVVNTTADDPDTNLNGTCADDINGDCTLRAAIQEMNATGDSTNTITIPAVTITLADNLPDITAPVTIQGSGMGDTIISGGGQWQVVSSDANTAISDLTVTAFSGIAISVAAPRAYFRNLEINGLNASSTGFSVIGGILVATNVAEVENVHIHDFLADGVANGMFGLNIHAINGETSAVSVSKTTVSNFSSNDSRSIGIAVNNGALDGSLTPATSDLTVENTTITNLRSGTDAVYGLVAVAVVNNGSSFINIDLRNNTISNLVGSDGAFAGTAAVVLGGAALGGSDVASIEAVGVNNLLASGVTNCFTVDDAAPLLGAGTSSGTVTNTISSAGGNLTDDTSCNAFYTQPTDQNNITNLASTLGPLSDNGGFVPTIPLLQGSPAIDSGVTVAGLTTDARQAVRPQGTAYDSGAYESPYSKPAAASLASTGQDTTLFTAIAISMLTLATGVGVFRRQLSN